MKSKERILVRPLVYMVISCVVWGFALWFFSYDLTTWMVIISFLLNLYGLEYRTKFQESPAQSRTHNQECLLLDFYDAHDIWHFLSATSLFFSFMVMSI